MALGQISTATILIDIRIQDIEILKVGSHLENALFAKVQGIPISQMKIRKINRNTLPEPQDYKEDPN